MRHLKERQDYIDRYDRHTVEECRRIETSTTAEDVEKMAEKNPPKEKINYQGFADYVNNVHLWCYQGERYKNKDTTINEWMERDLKMDACYDTAVAPNVPCLTCHQPVIETFKNLDWDYDKDTGRVLFMYDCKNGCLPRRAFYDNGEQWVSPPRLCVKCKTPTTHETEKTETQIIWIDTCPKCGHIEKDEMELHSESEEEKPDPNYVADRDRFCDPKKGQDYVNWMANAKGVFEMLEKHKVRETKKEVYDKVSALTKLSIPSVKDRLEEVISKTTYRGLKFKEPDLARIVSVEFTVEDPTDNKQYDSEKGLKKLIQKSLEETNWRLMSDGISYRLGILSGRIRVYENEDELAKLIEKQ